MKSGIKSVNAARQKFSKAAVTVNTARPVNTTHPKTTTNAAKPSSSNDKALDKEDTSKPKRIDEIDADEDIALEEVVEVVTTAKMIIDDVVDDAQVTTTIADITVSAAETIVTTAPTIIVESTKINVKVTQAPKRKGVMILEPEETTTTTKTASSQQPQVQEKDAQLAQRWHEEEQLQLTDAEKAELFMKFIEIRRKFFAAKRAEEKRNKPPTKPQQIRDDLEQERSKKQKMKDDKESAKLKKCLEILPDDVTIDATPLSSKSPTIVDYKIYKEGKQNYFQIFKADGNSQMLKVKAWSTLMMGIPNEHQIKFNFIKDTKSLLEAIEKRFSGNDAIKKTQRNLLKQSYENWTASSSKSLDQTFDRLQKLVIWRNKPNLDSISMDDLYNNLKVYALEVKGVSSLRTNTQNMAFVSSSSNNNTNSSNAAVNTAFGVTTAGTQSLNKLIDSQIVDNCKKGLGYNAVLPPHTGLFILPKPDLSYIDLEEFTSEPVVETLNAKTSEEVPKVVKDNGASIIEDWKSDDEDESVP
nr:ribonuclease H-like domain-containing protein [Tanacetum cinerariifolium]